MALLRTNFLFPMARMQCVAALEMLGLHSLIICGCRSPQPYCNSNIVQRQLSCRTGYAPESVAPGKYMIPAGVELPDGLTEGEAIHIALTNNSAFQAILAQLGMAGGDTLQASLLANPQLLIYFPTSIKEGQYTLIAPIESFLLRPTRVKAANREYRRVGEQLVQNGLNLARDVRIAYTDFALANQHAELAREALAIRQRIDEITQRRLADGDISELETITVRVDQLNATASLGVQQQTVAVAEARLVSLIGLPLLEQPLIPVPLDEPAVISLDESALIAQALACRPDYHAARWAVAAACQRARLSKWSFLRLDGVLDIRSGIGGDRTGGGLRADLPIFNRNQGGIARANWEVNAASHSRDAIHDQIVQDVRTAARQLQQARDNLEILNRDVAPALADALSISEKGFSDGGTDYLLVLQTTSQYLDAQARILDQTAACRRAIAELERSVGCSLEGVAMDIEALLLESAPPEVSIAESEELAAPTAESAVEVGN